MTKYAILTRARCEATIARQYIINDLIPEVERIIDAIPDSGELALDMPDLIPYIRKYVAELTSRARALSPPAVDEV